MLLPLTAFAIATSAAGPAVTRVAEQSHGLAAGSARAAVPAVVA